MQKPCQCGSNSKVRVVLGDEPRKEYCVDCAVRRVSRKRNKRRWD